MTDFDTSELELGQVLSQIASGASTEAGGNLVLSWHPSPDPEIVRRLLTETGEACAILEEGTSIPGFEGVFGIQRHLDLAGRGGVLDPEGIHQISRTVESALRIKSDLARHRERAPTLAAYGKWIGSFEHLLGEIDGCIDRDLTVKDSASPELRKVRRELSTTRDRVHRRASELMRGLMDKGHLQEALVTVRNNRFVLPFRSEMVGRQEVVVQDVSGSAATTFAEPLALVGLNNELQSLLRRETAEIERVLRVLSEQIAGRVEDIRNAWDAAVRLDARFAAARWCRQKECRTPEITKDEIFLINCRHPLIAPPVTPIEIRIQPPERCMVITGPNAGGKTAALKTLGIFALMLQCGLPLPVGEGSRIPIFGGVYAEIGDEQSLEGSLSTFSAHISFVRGLFERLAAGGRRERFLILLDEIGRATDPTEGSALALSVIEKLLDYSTHVVVTTHLPALKNLAMSGDERIICSTVDFDLEHLKPLFHISYGVPGKSYALQVARRLGLSESIVERAYGRLGEGQLLLEDDIGKLEKIKRKLESDLVDLRERLADDRVRSGEMAARSLACITFGMGVVREALERAEKILKRAGELSDGLVKSTVDDLRRARRKALEQAKINADAIADDGDTQDEDQPAEDDREVEEDVRNSLKESDSERERTKEFQRDVSNAEHALAEAGERLMEEDPGPVDLKTLREGDMVYVRPLKVEGEVHEINRRSKRVTVSIGGIASTVKPDDLRLTGRRRERESEVRLDTSGLDRRSYRKVVGMTLDLHGMRVDEALDEIERYLDEAFVAHHRHVILLHGIGTGALRNAVRRYLHKHPLVASYAPGGPGDGGPGSTRVEFVGDR